MSRDDILLYIGACTDTLPLDAFPEIKEFIYVDQMPKDEINHFRTQYKPCIKEHDQKYFCNELIRKFSMQKHKIKTVKRVENKMTILFDEDRIFVYYYIYIFE